MAKRNPSPASRQASAKVDFGKIARNYATYRAGFPEAFFDKLLEMGLLGTRCRAIDIGTGTGTVTRGLARRGAQVLAIDPAAELLAEAERLSTEEHDITYRVGRAEAIEAPDCLFDLAVAGQCWHWFDRPTAAAEAFRVLKPGGHLVIAHFDWLPLPGNVVAATEELICTHNPHWNMGGGTGLYPEWFSDLTVAKFIELQSFSFDVSQPYTHQAWRHRIIASAGIGASLDAASVARFDMELAALLATRFPDDPLQVPHRVWAVIGRLPSHPR